MIATSVAVFVIFFARNTAVGSGPSMIHARTVDQIVDLAVANRDRKFEERASRSRPAPTTSTSTTRPRPKPKPASTLTRAIQQMPRRTYRPGVEQWRAAVSQYPWNVETALRIMQCESGGNPNAYNSKYGATGLFQILHGPWDPYANIARAYEMYSQRGWQPWVCK